MRLSLCIPTYNRADTLRQLLDSIIAQQAHTLHYEIVVSDNASTDQTPEVIAEYRDCGLPIVYHRFDDNRGFDRNALNAVAIASGEFCWLFGSDDILEPTAFQRVEHAIDRHPGIAGLSVGSHGYNADLSQPIFIDDHISTTFGAETLFIGRDAIIGTLGAWMGYMSSLIVRRSSWQNAVRSAPIEPYLRGYVHLYLIARMLDDQATWLCLPDRLVGCRTGNESFLRKDEFARTKLDIEGYEQAFGDTLGRDNPAFHRAIVKVANFYVRGHFVNAKVLNASPSYWHSAWRSALPRYWRYPTFWLRTVPVMLMPRWLLRLMQVTYTHTLKRLRYGS